MDFRERLNYSWRLLATALSYMLFGLGGIIFPLVAVPVFYFLPGGMEQRQKLARRLVRWLFTIFIHVMRGLGILRWQVKEQERLHRPGLLVLANHPTLLDVVFLVSFIPNATCLVKGRLRGNPAMSGFIALTGYISNDAGMKMLDAANATLAKGGSLIVFPEGTRTHDPSPLRFKRGAANIAVRSQRNITPVLIHCAPPTLSKELKWYQIPPKPFVMSFAVKDDIAISPYLEETETLSVRKLTRTLESFFTKEYQAHADRVSQ